MEFKHPNRSFVAFVIIFILVIVIGLLTINKPDLTYKMSMAETVEKAMLHEDEISPEKLATIIQQEDPAYVLIDLRSPYEFIKGHISGAVNIPANSILDKENLALMDELASGSVTAILYGQDQLEANGPWMILKQMGYQHVKVLLGGYHYFANARPENQNITVLSGYSDEEPAFDFNELMEKSGSRSAENTGESQQQTVIPTRKKKGNVVEGGC